MLPKTKWLVGKYASIEAWMLYCYNLYVAHIELIKVMNTLQNEGFMYVYDKTSYEVPLNAKSKLIELLLLNYINYVSYLIM